jgi:hypothetical protein
MVKTGGYFSPNTPLLTPPPTKIRGGLGGGKVSLLTPPPTKIRGGLGGGKVSRFPRPPSIPPFYPPTCILGKASHPPFGGEGGGTEPPFGKSWTRCRTLKGWG